MKKVLLFAAVTAIAYLCSCNSTTPDNSLQIGEDDVIELDGSFDEKFLSSWEYIVLDDKEADALVSGDVNRVLYDDGLYFISTPLPIQQIKVYDSDGHYLNDIGRTGRARNEFVYLREWTIDRNKNEVLITSQEGYAEPVTIKKYDYEGNFLGQFMTDSLGSGTRFGHVSKCLSDGTLLVESGFSWLPSYDYLYIPQNGKASSPLGLTHNFLHDAGYSDEEVEEIAKNNPFIFYTIINGSYNLLSDTTYVVRLFDNHIYSITENSSECLVNLAFRPTLTKKERKRFNPETSPSLNTLPGYVYDYKDYLYIWYYGGPDCVYEKATSKVYALNGNRQKQMLPGYVECSLYGNDKIACVDAGEIIRANERIESDDYDHKYSPELEDFYRKVKDCGNPVLIIAHYDKKPQ